KILVSFGRLNIFLTESYIVAALPPDFRSFSLREGVEAFVYKGFSFLGTTLFCYFTILNISLHVRGV
ncbi:MAG: hypothetical protein WCG10_07825, partial [Chlamydiota bacterium]